MCMCVCVYVCNFKPVCKSEQTTTTTLIKQKKTRVIRFMR